MIQNGTQGEGEKKTLQHHSLLSEEMRSETAARCTLCSSSYISTVYLPSLFIFLRGQFEVFGVFFVSDILFPARFDLLFSVFAGCCNTQRNKVVGQLKHP